MLINFVFQLYVTGLKLGEETELELGDLIICDASGMNFGQFTGFSTMITLAKGSPQVKVFRKHDMKTLRNTINKIGKNMYLLLSQCLFKIHSGKQV